jgi:hypothetical protein
MASATSVCVTTLLAGSPPRGVSGGWIAITIPKGAVLLLTPAEVAQALWRGKYWTRHQALAARLQAAEEGR